MDIDLDIGGGNTVFVVELMIAAAVAGWLLERRRRHPEYGGNILADLTTRISAGFILICLGPAIRIAGWLPWRAMLYAGNRPLADWWQDLAWIWTSGGALIQSAGLALVFWPMLRRAGLAVAIVSPLAIAVGLYLLGAGATWLASFAFQP